jgi:hypothetical protein
VNLLGRIFEVDLRSLGLFRVLTGFFLVLDSFQKLTLAGDFYTDFGVLPRAYWIEQFMSPWKFSFHLANGELWFQVLLILAQLLFALFYLFGFRPKLFGFLTFVLLSSLQSRNFLILSSADDLLRLMLLWSLFTPIGSRFAMNNDLQPTTHAASGGIAVLMLQLLAMYSVGAIFKMHPVWTSELSGVYYALNVDIFVSSFGHFLRQYYLLTQILTAGTFALELLGPLFALIPGWPRLLVCLGFMSFHFGLFLSFKLGLFPWVAIAYWTLFLPSIFWDTALGGSIESFLSIPATMVRGQVPSHPRFDSSWMEKGLVGVLAIIALLFVIDSVKPLPPSIQGKVRRSAYTLNLNQVWDMFSPYPIRNDGWFVLDGEFKDGTHMDLLTEKPPTVEKPAHPAAAYPNSEWRKFLLNVWDRGNSQILLPFAKFQCRKNSSSHGADQDLIKLTIQFVKETTPPPSNPWAPPELITLWNHDCFAP